MKKKTELEISEKFEFGFQDLQKFSFLSDSLYRESAAWDKKQRFFETKSSQ